ncbi:MAG: thioredoxin family protein [Candidatus Latescibacteria bacterium]|nr:thioredoxin family protein [Candidatus Latescibacterota bacterium]
MSLLKEKDREQVRKTFGKLTGNVRLVMFTQEIECPYCRETRELMQEIASLSDKIIAEVYDFVSDKEKVEQYGIDKIPAIVVEGEKDYGIRFYGIPGGYEFTSLMEDILDVSAGRSGLSSATQASLAKLDTSVHIQVFVTLTCPYCPAAVRLAHRLAIERDAVRADMVETAEFPHLAHQYNVFSVPKVVINEETEFEGALPEAEFVAKVLEATREKA